MATQSIYSTARWRKISRLARERDGGCAIGRLTGTSCSPGLDTHHIIPVEDGGSAFDLENVITLCDRHHPALEGFRRRVLRLAQLPRCPHRHATAEGRRICEERLARLRATS